MLAPQPDKSLMHPFCVKPISQLSALDVWAEIDLAHRHPEFSPCCCKCKAGCGHRFLNVTLQTVQVLTCSEACALLWVHTLQQLATSLNAHKPAWRGAKHIPLLQLGLQMRAVPARALWHQPLNVHFRSCSSAWQQKNLAASKASVSTQQPQLYGCTARGFTGLPGFFDGCKSLRFTRVQAPSRRIHQGASPSLSRASRFHLQLRIYFQSLHPDDADCTAQRLGILNNELSQLGVMP